MYIQEKLHVHLGKTTCTSRKNYMYIQKKLHVHADEPQVSWRSLGYNDGGHPMPRDGHHQGAGAVPATWL